MDQDKIFGNRVKELLLALKLIVEMPADTTFLMPFFFFAIFLSLSKKMRQVLFNKGFTLSYFFSHPRLHSREQVVYFHCEVPATCTSQTFNGKHRIKCLLR